MKKIGVILGSIRVGRNGDKVMKWLKKQIVAAEMTEVEFVFLDLKDWPLPMFSSELAPMMGEYEGELPNKWAKTIAALDGFLIVTPEYNHGYPAVLKNALDHLYKEWNHKPVAFLSYGGVSGGIRAIEQLRQVVIELQMVPLRAEASIPFVWQAFQENGEPVYDYVAERVQGILQALKVAVSNS